MQDNKPGRFYGAISFWNVIISIALTYIIILLSGAYSWIMDIEKLIKLVGISNGIFLTVWGAIFGSGAIKKWKGIE